MRIRVRKDERRRGFFARFRPGAFVYEIELAAPGTAMYTADYDLITDSGDERFIAVWVERSIRYWSTRPTGIAEILIGGEVVIRKTVQGA